VSRKQLVLEKFLPYRLSVASNAVSQLIAQSYEQEFELKMQEWRVIAVLAEGGELTQQEIVGLTKMDKMTVSRAAQVLEGREILKRLPNQSDARSLRLSLTAQGRRIHAKVGPRAIELEQKLLAEFTDKEVATLDALLRRLEKAASAE
jgi:DNA-binding MarR family transcriptional regulator